MNPNGNDPLFKAARVTVNLKLLPLLCRRIEIQKVELDRPTIRVRMDSNGRTNLPEAANNSTTNSRFETQVALLIIRDGLIDYDDRQIPLSAELRNFNTRVALDRATNSYKGLIAYDAGRIETSDVRTFEHSAELHFVADATHCVIESIDFLTLYTRLRAHGEVTDYKSPVFNRRCPVKIFAGS